MQNAQVPKSLQTRPCLTERLLMGRKESNRTKVKGVCGLETLESHCVVVLEQLRHIYPSLVLVQPRKTGPCLTERLLMGRKESDQIKVKGASTILLSTHKLYVNEVFRTLETPRI